MNKREYAQANKEWLINKSKEQDVKALKLYPIEDVWGIGRRYSAKLISLGIKTAYDFAVHEESWVRAMFNNQRETV